MTALLAWIYARVSSDGQEENGTSLDTQVERCVAHAATLGLTVGRIVRETYSGAELFERPLLNEVRAAIRASEINVLMVYAVDRLSRDPIHVGLIAQECERWGVQLIFVSEPLDTTPEGQLIGYVRGWAAQLERAKIRERTQRGRRARIDSGRISPGAKDLYGYSTDRTLGRRSEKPKEAAIVRQIFSWVGADGIGVRTVIRRLNDLGIPPPSAGHFRYKDGRTPRWGKGTLQRILAEPAYKGQAYGLRWGAKRREGAKWKSPFYKPREEWVALHETTPALIAESVWDAAQQRASLNAGSTARNAQKPYLLRGLISCATCGRPMRTNPEKGKHTYRCSARETPAGACGGARASAEVEAEVLWAARWHVSNPDYMLPPALAVEDRTIEHLRVDAEAARSTIARLDRAQERLVARFSAAEDETTFPWQVVEREVSRLETEKQGWIKTLADIETRSAARSNAHEQRELVWKWSATVAGHYGVGKAFAGLGLPQPEMTFAEQRGLLEALGVRVYANGREWRLEAEFDPAFVAGNGHPIRSLRGSSTRPAVVTFSLRRADFQTLRSAA